MDTNQALMVLKDNPMAAAMIQAAVSSALAGLGPDALVGKFGAFEQFVKRLCNGVSLAELANMDRETFVEKFLRHLVPGAAPHNHGGCGCDKCFSYAVQIQMLIYQRCKMHLDPCDLKATNQAAIYTAFPLIKDDLTRQEMRFVPATPAVTGVGLNALGQATTFVADFSGGGVGASETVVLAQDPAFGISWKPGCLDPSIVFSGGTDAENFKFLRFTVWVARREDTLTPASFGPGGNAKPWNEWQIIEGKKFFCGETCSKEGIEGPSGCAGEDPVGPGAKLIIKIDNILGASEAMVQGSEVKVDFAGRVKPCCNTCGISGGSDCSCKLNRH